MKCPHCHQVMIGLSAQVSQVTIGGTRYKSIIYSCQLCESVISCQLDPISIAEGIIQVLRNILRV